MNEISNTRKNLLSFIYIIYGIGFILLLLDIYYCRYAHIEELGLNITPLDAILIKPLFVELTDIKFRYIILLFPCAALLYPYTYTERKSFWKLVLNIAIFAALFIAIKIFQINNYIGSFIYAIGSVSLYIFMIRTLQQFSAYISVFLPSLKNNEIERDGFEQTTDKIVTEDSINLRYSFHYKTKKQKGWINIVNLYRATAVIGLPGSGKSFAIILQIMRQTILRGWSAVIYDYKDPDLADKAYTYHLEYLASNPKGTKTEFKYLSFKDIRKSYRCNPIKNITSSAESQDIAFSILVALNKSMEGKQGEFFTESAIKYTALNIYILGLTFQGRYQTLPHLLSLISRPAEETFKMINYLSIFYPDLRTLYMPFSAAYENDVLPQLQGQLASAQIGLGSITDPILAYVMTESEEHPELNIDLDINDPNSPKILVIGNDPQKDKVYGLATSVYLTRLAKIVNKKGNPALFCLDELVTTYVKHLDNLIATARSNKIAVLLGFQDFTQIIRDYNEKVAKAIIGTTSNLFSGSVKGETAKSISESFGEKHVKKFNKTMNDNGGHSTQISDAKEKKIPIATIEELSQGTFVGRVVDNFGTEIKNKVFCGEIEVPALYSKKPKEIPILRDMTDEEISKETFGLLFKITDEVSDFLKTLNSIAREFENLKTHVMNPKNKDNDDMLYYTLESYIENDIELGAAIFIEGCYAIISNHAKLNLKYDYLTDRKKIHLFIRYFWKESKDAIEPINDFLDKYNINSLDKAIDIVERLSD